MKNKLVSVIIVNWNGKKWLKRCLDSLVSQTYQPLEIILVDNASSDDSVAFVKSNYPNIKLVISDKNLGFAGGNNYALESASGELILFINNDTWVKSNFVEELVRQKEKHGYDIIAPHEAFYEGVTRNNIITSIDPLGHPINLSFSANQKSFYLSGVAILFARDLYDSTGGLDNSFFMYFEEIDWFWRLNLLRKTSGYADQVHIYHHGAGSTGSGIKYNMFLWRNQNTLQMVLKNYRGYTLFAILPLYLIQNIVEILAFLILLKPRIAWSYIEGWAFNLKNIKPLMAKRRWIQHNREITDRMILKKMFIGPGKLYHLFMYMKRSKI